MNNIPIIVEKVYPVAASKVWKALTDKNQMKEWYFDIEDFQLKESAEFNFTVSFEGKEFHHHCVIKEIIPEKKFVHTWSYPDMSKGDSVVTWELEPVDKGTKLTLTHRGIETFAGTGEEFNRESFEDGWEEILGTYLKDFLAK